MFTFWLPGCRGALFCPAAMDRRSVAASKADSQADSRRTGQRAYGWTGGQKFARDLQVKRSHVARRASTQEVPCNVRFVEEDTHFAINQDY